MPPPPQEALPFSMVTPEIAAVTPELIENTCTAPPPLTVKFEAPGPLIVKFWAITSVLVSAIVAGYGK